jgi:hypothetical protein
MGSKGAKSNSKTCQNSSPKNKSVHS